MFLMVFFGGILIGVIHYGLNILLEVNFTFSGLADLSFCFILDWVGRSFLMVVLVISFRVIVYSSYYIGRDPNKSRFS